MDYKTKFPDLNVWRGNTTTKIKPCPFDVVSPYFSEHTSPHDSSIFLGKMGIVNPDDYLPFLYLAQAPRDCPMRICMETGDIEIYDYWMSRPWLIELQFSLFDDSHFSARYISPRQMCQGAHNNLRNAPEMSPLDRKLKSFKEAIEDDEKYKPRRVPAWQKDLAEFMHVYEQKKAIAKKALKSA